MGGDRIYTNAFIKCVVDAKEHYTLVLSVEGEKFRRPIIFAKNSENRRYLTKILHEEPEIVATKGDVNIPTEIITVVWDEGEYPEELWGLRHDGEMYHFSIIFDIYNLGDVRADDGPPLHTLIGLEDE
jgi:hypothetical protein